MIGPTPSVASRAIRDELQRLLSCVTTAVLHVDETGPTTILTGQAHLHTGFVTPVAVLVLAVEQFGVVTRRADWAAVFERTARTIALG